MISRWTHGGDTQETSRLSAMAEEREDQVIWIGIDPNLLLGGLDTQAMFGCDNYLKMNLMTENQETNKQKVESDSEDNIVMKDDQDMYENSVKDEAPSDDESVGEVKFAQELLDDEKGVIAQGGNGVKKEKGRRKRSKMEFSLKCGMCKKMFRQLKSFRKHQLRGDCIEKREALLYDCGQCQYQTTDQGNLTRHIQSIHEGVRYDCGLCDYKAKWKIALTRHIQAIHEGVRYNCTQCDYQATTQNHLNRHTQAKHEGVKYDCIQCDYQTTDHGNLTRHVQSVHEGVRYNCDQCDYQATRQNHLNRHIQSKHEGVRYDCDQCEFQSTLKSSLTRHIQSKHQLVRYDCDQCDYKATRQDSLISHMLSKHEGVTYDCDQCDYKARWRVDLRRHIMVKHEGVKYYCDQCDYQATRPSYLTSHIQSKHEENPPDLILLKQMQEQEQMTLLSGEIPLLEVRSIPREVQDA